MTDAPRSRPRRLVAVLLVAGGVLAALGLIAGHLNRQLLDGPQFAENVDQIRRNEDVTTALGRVISTEVVLARPDLVALRPLVEAVSIQVAGGDLLSGPTRAAASAAHTALTESDADLVVLRVADAGAIVASLVAVVAPEQAPITADVSVRLASIGGQDFAAATLALTRALGVLAWLVPLLSLCCFAAAIALSSARWDTAAAVGWALVWAAVGVSVLLLVGGILVRRLDQDVLSEAVGRAAWAVVMRPLWWGVVILAAAGLAVTVACGSSVPATLLRAAGRVREAVLARPSTVAGVVVRALGAALLGLLAIADPTAFTELAVVLGGALLVLFAMAEIATVAAPARARPVRSESRRAVPFVAGAVAFVLVAAGIAVLARPGDDLADATAAATAGEGEVCNGHAELCDRPFDEVAYVAAHNAMAVAREPGWFLPEQVDPIPVQLDQGTRALLVDVWSGVPAGDVVRTAASNYEEALAVAEQELGPEIVAAGQRIANSVAGEAQGAEARFLCHGLCETGSTPFLEALVGIRGWMVAHPDEVVTLFIEDHVDADLIAADIEAAGLVPLVYQPEAGAPWPTLGEMIRSGRRLVVMLEEGRGGDDAPWLVNGFEFTQETPYTFPTVDDLNCDPNRGPPDAPLFQMNHWLSGFSSLVTNAQLVNTREVLLSRAQNCETERGQIPNFVAVNYSVIGDVFAVVDELNGVA